MAHTHSSDFEQPVQNFYARRVPEDLEQIRQIAQQFVARQIVRHFLQPVPVIVHRMNLRSFEYPFI